MFLSRGVVWSVFGKINWKLPLPKKVKTFNWLAINKRILTVENLKKRKWTSPQFRLLCGEEEETVDHIYFPQLLLS